MDREELKDCLTQMYIGDPEVSTVRGLMVAFEDADGEVPLEKDIQAACEELVAEGVLQRAGRSGFEATMEFMIEQDIVE